jgi:uncharacterized protein (DUF305 family)
MNQETDIDERRSSGAPFLSTLRQNRVAAALVAVILVGIGVFSFQWIPRDPGEDSAEAGFARDMSAHHGQAVQMAMIIRDRTGDEQLFFLATDIALMQQGEIGQMTGWLLAWGLDVSGSGEQMAWMGMPTTGLMPGMATQDQIAQLETLPVDEAEVLFLHLMIRHHQGGVDMAEAYLDRGDNDVVTAFAEQVIRNQAKEIDTMNAMLEQRGQAPITDPLPSHDSH